MLLETIIRFDKTVIDSKWVALNIFTMSFFCNILVYVHQGGDQKHEGLDSQKNGDIYSWDDIQDEKSWRLTL
jgi:hypothetical protein